MPRSPSSGCPGHLANRHHADEPLLPNELVERRQVSVEDRLKLSQDRVESGTEILLLDPAGDEDGDGQSNGDEEVAGTDALDSTSVFRALSIERSGADVVVGFSAVVGMSYQLERGDDLNGWTPVGPVLVADTESESITDVGGFGSGEPFYRVRVVIVP